MRRGWRAKMPVCLFLALEIKSALTADGEWSVNLRVSFMVAKEKNSTYVTEIDFDSSSK